MKGIITGARGFIGQQVLRSFKEAGYEVGAVDLYDPKVEGVPFRKANITSKKEVDFAFNQFYNHFEGLDFVIHLAACFNYSKPESMMRAINVGGTKNVADAAVNRHVKHFINMGAVAEYKEGAGLEDKIKEDHPLEAIEKYGKTKHEAENLLFENYHKPRDYHSQNKLNVATFRACMVYGHFQQGTYVDAMFNMIKDNKIIPAPMKQTKNSYVHTKNIARAFMHALENPDKVFNKDAKELNDIAYNLGEDEVITEVEVMRTIAKMIPDGKSRIVLPIIPSPLLKIAAHSSDFIESFMKSRTSLPVGVYVHSIHNHNLDTRKFEETGFEYANTLEEGLRDVVNEYYSKKVWTLPKPEFVSCIID